MLASFKAARWAAFAITLIMIISVFAMTVVIASPANAAEEQCKSKTAYFQVKDGPARIGTLQANLLECNNTQGRLSDSRLSVDADLNTPADIAGWKFTMGTPRMTSSNSSHQVWEAVGKLQLCVGYKFVRLCSFMQTVKVRAVATSPTFIGPRQPIEVTCRSSGRNVICSKFIRVYR